MIHVFTMPTNLHHPTELQRLCETYGLRPSKQYGQHYLISRAPIEKMIAAAGLDMGDTVVEIGPGFGVLTLAVAPLVKRVVAFEIEQKLRPYWAEKMPEYPNVEVVWGNALEKIKNQELPGGVYKVLANLPYHITSDALRTILALRPLPACVVVMVQKEVAERICAKPGSMSMLSVAVQYYGVPSLVAGVSAGSFWPVPKVASAVVSIKTRKQESPDVWSGPRFRHRGNKTISDQVFFRVVRAGFAQKRKQLWHNISSGLSIDKDMVQQCLLRVTGSTTIRAQEVSMSQWGEIVACLTDHLQP